MPEEPETTTSSLIASILRDPGPALPPKKQKFGSSTVEWWSPRTGEAIIMAHGGTCDDRTLAEQMVKIDLAAYGYQRVAFTFEESTQRQSSWDDIMAKAKRLVQSGQVYMLRNGYNNVVGHVIGDHGEYLTEIGRDDPKSRAITTWQCECPWDQYAWQRTRQWKRLEGRPCSHVLALYWKALTTPLDEDLSPDQAQGMGTGQKLPSDQPAPAPGDSGMAPPPDQAPTDQAPPPDGSMAPPDAGPAQAPMAPPGQPGILPPAPMDMMQQMMQPPPPPGMTPPGMPGPPNSVSVPGARMPTPFNPIQYPGGTYSKTAAEQFTPPEIVRLVNPTYGLKEGREGATDAGQYTEIPAGSTGEVLAQDETTGWVEVIFPLDGGPMTSYHARCFCEPKDLQKTRLRPPGPFVRRH